MRGVIAFLSLILFGSVLFAKPVYLYYDGTTKDIGTRSPASIDKVRKENKKPKKSDVKADVKKEAPKEIKK